MKNPDKFKSKFLILLTSIFFTSLNIFLFFLDQEYEWETMIIYLCALTSLWAFFVFPAYRYYFLKIKLYNEEKKEQSIWKDLALIIPFFVSPLYGIKYYFYPKISKVL